MVGSSIGFLWKNRPDGGCQLGSLEPFVADKMMVSNGVIGAICN